jgi:hypothetical protein
MNMTQIYPEQFGQQETILHLTLDNYVNITYIKYSYVINDIYTEK